MKRLCGVAIVLAIAQSASAAPNVTNTTQKGSLLLFPDIRVDGGPTDWNTLIRIQNDGSNDMDIVCYWMDGFKNRVDIGFTITRNQALWFDARTGRGTLQVNPFPLGAANGFTNTNRHPFLRLPTQTAVDAGYGTYRKGLLACWAVAYEIGVIDPIQRSAKWNHLTGTATVYHPTLGAYEYNAHAFFVPTGTDAQAVPLAPGQNRETILLNGVQYDSCPMYLIGQFTPNNWTGPAGFGGTPVPLPAVDLPAGALAVTTTRLAVMGCSLDLSQDWVPSWTKLQFDVWNSEEVKFTGAYECADTWHETDFRAGLEGQLSNAGPAPAEVGPGFVDGIDAAAQNFTFDTLSTYAARYRVQGLKSTQCARVRPSTGVGSDVGDVATAEVGLIGVQSMWVGPATDYVGTGLAAAGKLSGKITWNPAGTVPEGGIR